MKLRISIVFLTIIISVKGQTGGDATYEFLNLSPNALLSSLGGTNVSLWGDDPNYYMQNPALLNELSCQQLAINYTNYFAGINYGSINYAMPYKNLGNFAAGITYLNYGKFKKTDPSGNITGSFNAAEYAFNLIWSYNIDSLWNIGMNLKPVISQMEQYNSLGLALDIGAAYHSRDGLVSAGLAMRNIGLQLTTYTGTRERLPFEITAGVSGKLEHAPLRLSLTLIHLEKYDLLHEYLVDENSINSSSVADLTENIMRHMIVGVEFIPSENFFISSGFNYKRRKELLLDSKASTVGFSLGLGIKTSRINLYFSRSKYHLAGSLNTFSLIIKPSAITKKK